jgi:hypothetical protein
MTKRIMKIVVFGLSIFFVSSLAYADEVGRFTAVDGRVDVLNSGEDKAILVGEGDVVSSGSIIRTKSLSKAEIKFTDNTILKLAENTRLEIKEYTLNEFGLRENAVIDLQRGEIRAIIKKTIGKTNFFVNTPNASGSVKGTDIFVFYHKSATGVLVNDGNFSVINNDFPDREIKVAKGLIAVVPPDQPPQKPRPYLDVEKNRHEAQTTIVRAPASDDPSQIGAMIVKLSGEVKVKRAGETTWRDAALHDVLGTGDYIQTKESGKVEFKLDNGHIITLKSNSTIILKKLMRDVNTGDEENLFESNLGNIRAKVQKLKGNSKFEIKTPTAVAAVRGTTMYLMILPGLTTIFSEDGDSTLTSLISQISKTVQDGQTSSADDQGNVSDSTDTTDDQKSKWTGGWGDTGEAEPYTEPGGGEGGGGGDGGPPPDTGDGVDLYIPPDPGTTGPASTTQTNLIGTVEGDFGEPESEFNGTLTTTSTTTPWTGIDDTPGEIPTSPATLEGTYENPGDGDLWITDLTGTGDDGGAFTGLMGGAWNSWEGALASIYIDPSGIAGTMTGYLEGDDDESAGTLNGEGNIFFLPITQTEILPEDLIDPEAGVLSTHGIAGNMEVYFDDDNGSGYFDGRFDRKLTSLNGESWGTWLGDYMGGYDRPEGLGELEEYRWFGRGGGLFANDIPGYFISKVGGIDDLESFLRMDTVTTYLSPYYLGASFGTILGLYEEEASYYFEGLGLGAYLEEPLTFSGLWNEGGFGVYNRSYLTVGSLFYNNDGNINWAGEEHGLIGSSTPNWGLVESFPITAMGDYYVQAGSEPYIWNTPIAGYNADAENWNLATLDGGAFLGFTAGIWNEGQMDGSAAALYAYPTGDGMYDVGFLRGPITGEYYPGISMWMTDEYAMLSPTVMETGVIIDSFDERPSPNEISNGWLYGYFHEEGSIDRQGNIEGGIYQGYSLSPDEDEDWWGIYDIKFGNGNVHYNPDPDTYTMWSGVVIGFDEHEDENGDPVNGNGYYYEDDDASYWFVNFSGTWEDNEIRADANGFTLNDRGIGTIEGDFYGVNNGVTDTWIGSSIGVWQEDPLTFSGDWGEDDCYLYEWNSLYRNDGGYPEYAGYEEGLIGSSTPSWWSEDSFPFLAMGEYVTWDPGPYIWNTEIYSYSVAEDESGITADGGAFLGSTGGIWNDGILNGAAYAIYMDPSGNAGLLIAKDLYGDYYLLYEDEGGEEGLWRVVGNFTPTEMASALGIDPIDLENYIDDGDLYVDVYGGFDFAFFDDAEGYIEGWDSWGETTFIYADDTSQPWGIYDLKLEGSDSYYNPNDSTIWFAFIGGEGEFGDAGGGWIGGMGGIWHEGEIVGALRAFYATEDYEVGLVKGDVFGLYDEVEENYGSWIGESVGMYTAMGEIDPEDFEGLEDFEDFVEYGEFDGTGRGDFEGGGTLEDVSIEGIGISILDQDWGIWAAGLDGTYTEPNSPFRLALGCIIYEEEGGEDDHDGYILGTVDGDWDSGRLSGPFRGVALYDSYEDGKIEADIVTGDVIGTYIDVDELGTGTWKAAGIGEWVEVTDLLTPENLGFTITELEQFVAVPITETYANLLTGSQGFITAAAMDISLYNDWLWTALIYGTYDGAPVDPTDWTVTLSEGTDSVILDGTMWDDTANEWLADVTGTIDSNNITGEAGGIYGDGEFQGVGAGTAEAIED